jgi:nucleotide-binding universal stress UspA family protein
MLSEALLKANTKAPELNITKKMLEGRPANRIVDEAKEGDFDLIVMGSHGLGGLDRIILGSVSSEVSYSSEVPVMLIKQKDDELLESVNKILVPVDGSEKSKKAQHFALELAENFGADVDLLNVVSIGVEDIPVLPYPMQPTATRNIPDWIQPYSIEYKKESENFLSKFLKKARKSKPELKISKKIAEGKPADGILEVSEEGNYDMIVMGGSGWGNISSILLGSVSSRVANNSKIPVTIVK